MEETKPQSRYRRFADRLAVEEEPGLSTSQLMLTNYDLKPVEVSNLSLQSEPLALVMGINFLDRILTTHRRVYKHMLTTVACETNMAVGQLRRVLDRRQLQYQHMVCIALFRSVDLIIIQDDIKLHDYVLWAELVAELDLCLAGLRHCGGVRRHYGENWRNIPYRVCAWDNKIAQSDHVRFPVITRASFGIWGSLWPVFNRAVMACIWYD
jgi:hypothetical protein